MWRAVVVLLVVLLLALPVLAVDGVTSSDPAVELEPAGESTVAFTELDYLRAITLILCVLSLYLMFYHAFDGTTIQKF